MAARPVNDLPPEHLREDIVTFSTCCIGSGQGTGIGHSMDAVQLNAKGLFLLRGSSEPCRFLEISHIAKGIDVVFAGV